jgi:hypothetical protein
MIQLSDCKPGAIIKCGLSWYPGTYTVRSVSMNGPDSFIVHTAELDHNSTDPKNRKVYFNLHHVTELVHPGRGKVVVDFSKYRSPKWRKWWQNSSSNAEALDTVFSHVIMDRPIDQVFNPSLCYQRFFTQHPHIPPRGVPGNGRPTLKYLEAWVRRNKNHFLYSAALAQRQYDEVMFEDAMSDLADY